MSNSRLTISLILFALLTVSPVWADDYHYENHLIGERSAGMAGAYTAISDNAAGCYYNPAGIVYSVGSNFSASVNAFNNHKITYKSALTGTDGSSKDWEKKSTVVLPNFFGTVYDVGQFKIGFSYAVPDSTLREQEQHFSNIQPSKGVILQGYDTISDYTININDVDKIYLFGPTIAKKVNDDLSLGLTLYGYYRNRTEIINQRINLKDTSGVQGDDYQWLNNYRYQTHVGVLPILGVMFSPFDNISMGVTYSRLFPIDDTEEIQDTQEDPTFTGVLPKFTLSENTETIDSADNINAGIAWFPNPSFVLSADMKYYKANEDALEDVLNFAVGLEYYFNERYAIRTGAYTDFANTPELKEGKSNQAEHADLYGVTFAASRYSRNTSTTIGLGYTAGNGEAQVKANNTSIQDVEISSFTAYLSAAYNF